MDDPLEILEMFIMIKDGQPYQSPLFKEALLKRIPNIDFENLPENIVRFKRGVSPSIGTYEVFLGTQYVWDNGIVTEQFNIRPMTTDEKHEKQITTKLLWKLTHGNDLEKLNNWVFNEETCEYEPFKTLN